MIIEMEGKLLKRKIGIKSNLTLESSSKDPKDTFKYPTILTRPEFAKGRYFWQMPFREKLYCETMNPPKLQTSDSEDEGEEDTSDCPVPPPDPENLDPKMFAPTGNIYSYFQRGRIEPFPYSCPLMYSTRNCLGGRMLKSFVY